MKEKWLPVGILAGVLFAVNVLGRVIAKVWADGDDDRQINIGLVALGLVGLITLVASIRWVQRYPMPRVWGDLGIAVCAACLASVLIGPFLVGDAPFDEGAGLFFRQIWWYLGVTLGAGLFGALVVMTLGRDWKSKAWQRYAEQSRSRPRRVVRR
jgi:H+/Cl- antiporter ClcA